MMWWKRSKWKVLIPVFIVVVLSAAFFLGGDAAAPGTTDENSGRQTEIPGAESSASEKVQSVEAVSEQVPQEAELTEETDPTGPSGEIPSDGNGVPAAGAPEEDGESEAEPSPADSQEEESDDSLTCTISINCAAALECPEQYGPKLAELLPEDGWILEPLTVSFFEGESVFHVLLRTCKQQSIHMEYADTPIYHSAYIEGIQNLYEFDVGELSGWMYSVNGWFPNYGCGRYQLQDGDVICWLYTCDLGRDIGGGETMEGQRGE